MLKVYERINWENEPSQATALNEENLNKMDYALDEIDTRVTELGGYQEVAQESAEIAKTNANLSKSYAVGGTGTRTNENTDNAKYYNTKAKESADKAEQIASGIEGRFMPMGTITFEELDRSKALPGYMYNISNDFVTNAYFKEGAGIYYTAGTNVYLTTDNYWDCLAGKNDSSSQGRNLIPYPYYRGDSFTHNGITFTVNEKDGSIVCNGTAKGGNAQYNVAIRGSEIAGIFVKNGEYYTLSGCPNNGSGSTYRLGITYNKDETGTTTDFAWDYGDGVTFVPVGAYEQASISIAIIIAKGQTVNNLVFYPMLEEGNVAHAYEPTTESNVGILSSVKSSQGRNLIPYPYYSGNVYINNGITFTVNDDGSVTANGTATGSPARYNLHTRNKGEDNDFIIPNGTYAFSGCPKNGSSGTYNIDLGCTKNGAYSKIGTDYGNGITFIADGDDFSADSVNVLIQLIVYTGTTVNNLTFYPMLEEGNVKHAYEPTTESNVTLKGNLAQNTNDITTLKNRTGNLNMKFVNKKVTLPSGSSDGGVSSTTVDFSSDLPQNAILSGVMCKLGNYNLPYVHNEAIKTCIPYINAKNIVISNSSTIWSDYDATFTLFYYLT